MAKHTTQAPVLAMTRVTDTVWQLRAGWDGPVRAGQFFMLRGWQGKDPLLGRPISVHDWGEDWVDFLFEVRGEGTRLLSALEPGDTLELTGALGNGFETDLPAGTRVALVGGGIGVAPLLGTARALRAAGCAVTLFAGFRDEPYVLDKFEALGCAVQLATDSGRFGHKGFVTNLLNPADFDRVLVCGPEVMMEKIARACLAAKVPVFVSRESHMACGIGACLGCTCHTKNGPRSTCKDGPVFPGEVLYE